MASPSWFSYLPKILRKRLDGRESLLIILNNSGWLFLDKLMRLGLGVAVGIWVARYLGPSQFGELAYVLSYIAFFQAIANLGLDGITVRDISQNKNEANNLLGTVFLIRFFAGIFCWLFAIIAMGLINGWHDRSVLLIALVGSGLVFQSSDTIDLWFQSQSQNRLTILAKISSYFISAATKVLLIIIEAPLYAFASVFILEGSLAALGMAFAYKNYPCQNRWASTSKVAIRLLNESWPFILSGVSIMIYMRIDQIMIKEMLGVDSLGIYAAVLPLATLWQIIPVVLNASLAPFVTRIKNENENKYWHYLQKIFSVYAAIAWATIVPTILFAHWIVPLVYGSKYQEGVLVLSIYAFTNLFIYLGVAQGLWMLNEKRSLISIFNTIAGAFVSVVGNLLFIPLYGITGAAFVAVIAMCSSAVLANIIFSRRIFLIQLKAVIFLGFRNEKKAN